MYYEFFGLSDAPFKITPNTALFFEGGKRGAVLEALRYAITANEGIVKVVGEVGSGKTMLCRMLQNRLADNIETIYLANPSYSKDEILHAIAEDLGLSQEGKRASLVTRALQDLLIEKHAMGQQVVVFIDEAQAMPLETLEEIRLLSNLETSTHKLLQMVLFGQPELDTSIDRPEMRQLKERITHAFHLVPFRREDIDSYLIFRLMSVGFRGPQPFMPEAVELISKASEGLVRRVNILADKAMLAAFSEGSHTVTPEHARAAIRDSGYPVPGEKKPAGRRRFAAAAAIVATLAVAAGLYAVFWPKAPASAEATNTAAAAKTAAATPAVAAATPATPEAAMPQATASPPVEGSKLMQERIAASREWVESGNLNDSTLQLGLFSAGPDQLSKSLVEFGQILGGTDSLYVRPVTIGGTHYTGIFWGRFASRSDAVKAIQSLPEPTRQFRPQVRTIYALRGG